jgi:hypothetical protein
MPQIASSPCAGPGNTPAIYTLKSPMFLQQPTERTTKLHQLGCPNPIRGGQLRPWETYNSKGKYAFYPQAVEDFW